MRLRTNKKRCLSRPSGRRGVIHEALESRCLLTTLAISEINYHPYAPVPAFGESAEAKADDFEFIELLNTGAEAVSLSGVKLVQVDVKGKLEGVDFTFGNQSLAPNGRIVVVQNLQAFRSRYGETVPVAGVWSGGKLGDNDETLTLRDASDSTIFQVTYESNSAWPQRANGAGASLEIKDPDGNPNDPTNWRSSVEYGGSPGRAPGNRDPRVQINEVLAHTDLPQIDTVEFRNLTNAPIDISHWYFTDRIDQPFKYYYSFPVDTKIPANGYLLIDENDFNPRDDGIPPSFSLSEHGEEALLLISAGANRRPLNFEDVVSFEATINGVSVGNVNNNRDSAELLPLAELTLGRANTGHRVSDLVINEVQYRTPDNDVFKEYIELLNRSGASLDADDWRIADALEATIPARTTLARDETVVLVAFDPNDSVRADSFRQYYEIDSSVRLIGPWSADKDGNPDSLSNSGETVTLRLPLPDQGLNETFYGTMDQVDYRDGSPWPEVADGHGGSLSRTQSATYGNLPTSWQGTRPSPGNQPPDLNASPGLQLGQPIAANLGLDGALVRGDADIDTYRFRTSAEGRYRIRTDAEGTLGTETYLRLFDFNGQELAYSDNASGLGQLELPLAGATDYLVVVSVTSSLPRSYNPFTGTGLVPGTGRTGPYQLTVDTVIVNPFPWLNAALPEDVSGDGDVIPFDALLVINELNSRGASPLPVPPLLPDLPPPFLDVSGDNFLSPFDALLVINYLNEPPATTNARAAVAEAEPGGSDEILAAESEPVISTWTLAAASLVGQAARPQASAPSRSAPIAAAVDAVFAAPQNRPLHDLELAPFSRRRFWAG